MHKKKELALQPFQEWLNKQDITYAYDSKTDLRLAITLKGNMVISQNGEVKYQTLQPFNAIEKYNELLNPEQ